MTAKDYTTIPFQARVEKPWGYEIHYTPKDFPHTGKILFIKAGKRPSFQYHDEKQETLCLFFGRATIWLENDRGETEKLPMELRKGYIIRPFQKHRVEAIEDSFILEVSSLETGTTVRLEDDYNRPDETPKVRGLKNRGWSGEN